MAFGTGLWEVDMDYEGISRAMRYNYEPRSNWKEMDRNSMLEDGKSHNQIIFNTVGVPGTD